MTRWRRGTDTWSRTLTQQVGSADSRPICGVEHEFELSDDNGRVDARVLLPTLDVGRRRHDPIDPYATSLPDGSVLTADGREAEVAIAPVVVSAGFSGRASSAVAAARDQLEQVLPNGTTLAGYSTHLSVQVPDRRAPRAARFVARRFAPLLMLALENPASPGLLVRARWNRVEVGGDYVDGELLRAGLVIAVACIRHAVSTTPRRGLPRKPALSIEQSVERYGWYVDRAASGADLYAGGRSAQLRCGRTSVTVQRYVDECWHRLEPALREVADDDDVRLARDLIAGRLASALDH
jgi:hypothetical protein